jgi:hypothetical protein
VILENILIFAHGINLFCEKLQQSFALAAKIFIYAVFIMLHTIFTPLFTKLKFITLLILYNMIYARYKMLENGRI